MRNLYLSALLMLLAACPRQDPPPQEPPSADASAETETLPDLRPGTTVLFSRQALASTPIVLDAAVMGTRLLLLVRIATEPSWFDERSSAEEFLVTSDDEGQSWTPHPLEPELRLLALLPAPSGLFAIGNRSGLYRVYRLDPQSFRAAEVARLDAWPSYLAGGVAAGASAGGSTVSLSRFDAATGEAAETEAALPGNCQPRFASADGETFEGVCYLIDKRCWVTVRAGQTTAQSTCLGYREWPLPASATQAPIAIEGRVWLAYEEEGHVRARRMEGGAFGATVDLGPGSLDETLLQQHHRYRPPFEPLLPLRTCALRRLLELRTGNAPRNVVVADSPCLDAAACSDLQVNPLGLDDGPLRLLPLGGQRYLALFLLVQPPADPFDPWSRRWHLLARPAIDGEVAAPAYDTDCRSGRANTLEYVPADMPLDQSCALSLANAPGTGEMGSCLFGLALEEGTGPGPGGSGDCRNGRCEGTTLLCDNGSGVSRTECSRLGLTCETTQISRLEVRAKCIAESREITCDAGYQSDSCSGPYLVYCIGQQRRFIDCPALGFAGCTQEYRNQRYYAWCSR